MPPLQNSFNQLQEMHPGPIVTESKLIKTCPLLNSVVRWECMTSQIPLTRPGIKKQQ